MLRTLLKAPSLSSWKPQAAAQKPYSASQSHVPAHAWHVTTTFSARTKVKWWEDNPQLLNDLVTQLALLGKNSHGHNLQPEQIKHALQGNGITPINAQVGLLRLTGNITNKVLAERIGIDTLWGDYAATIRVHASKFKSSLGKEGIYFEYPPMVQEGEQEIREALIPLLKNELELNEEKTTALMERLTKKQRAFLLTWLKAPKPKAKSLAETYEISVEGVYGHLDRIRRSFKQAGCNDKQLGLLYVRKTRKSCNNNL